MLSIILVKCLKCIAEMSWQAHYAEVHSLPGWIGQDEVRLT